jgi:predicted site-specific integrase-resolvase
MTTEKWLDRNFDPSSRPSIATLQRWLRDGKIPAKKVGGTWFIDEHAWLADGDDLVARVLKAG